MVSVIIPTYNRAWALRRAVKSVFDDSYRPIECIVVDDGSTDDTAQVAGQLENECPFGIEFRYMRKENGGANSARNKGLVECTGDLICFLDSDDYLINESIKARATVFIDNPNVDLCYGLSSIEDETGKEIGTMNYPWPSENEARIARYLFNTNSPMIKRVLCEKSGLWREDMVACQEYEYFSRVKYWADEVVFIDQKLSVYTKHEKESMFNRSAAYSYCIFRSVLIVKGLIFYGKHFNKPEQVHLSLAFRHIAKMLVREKDYHNACQALKESLVLKMNLKVYAQWVAIKCFSMFHRP